MHDKTKALAVFSDNLSRNSLEKNILLAKIAIKITMMIDAQITVFLDICIYVNYITYIQIKNVRKCNGLIECICAISSRATLPSRLDLSRTQCCYITFSLPGPFRALFRVLFGGVLFLFILARKHLSHFIFSVCYT
jgi:hypothetical protein